MADRKYYMLLEPGEKLREGDVRVSSLGNGLLEARGDCVPLDDPRFRPVDITRLEEVAEQVKYMAERYRTAYKNTGIDALFATGDFEHDVNELIQLAHQALAAQGGGDGK